LLNNTNSYINNILTIIYLLTRIFTNLIFINCNNITTLETVSLSLDYL
jgi:hypothetical protein